MPIAGLGLHIVIALFFAVHAVRSRQQTYWLFVLFSFPLLGSIVYFLAIYLPDSRLERGARKAIVAAVKSLDPTRELRDARAAFEYTPTAQNQMRLASALYDAGEFDESAQTWEACLKGPFSTDLEIRRGAARASFARERPQEAISHLNVIRQQDPNFREEEISLLLARSLAAAGRHGEARDAFEATVARFGSFEARAEFAIWALVQRETELAGRLQVEIQRATERWNRHTRELTGELMRRLRVAHEQTRTPSA
jgi:hypothetical protein